VIILDNYAEVMLLHGQLQKALQYSQRAYEMSLLYSKFEAATFINRNLADINLALGNRELAKTYCNLNLTEAREKHYNKLYYFAYNGLGNYFEQTNQKDSAAYYYSLSLQYAKIVLVSANISSHPCGCITITKQGGKKIVR